MANAVDTLQAVVSDKVLRPFVIKNCRLIFVCFQFENSECKLNLVICEIEKCFAAYDSHQTIFSPNETANTVSKNSQSRCIN